MDSLLKAKDSNCNVPTAAFNHSHSAVAAISSICPANICSSDSFSIIPPPHHDLASANSIELNAAASLSDDSGVPLTTNSSISSGDSYRLGMCKCEIGMVESDGEVSQFDSLDNCSEGGMSAENFNTLKKGPLAPIDPPPEFQDSPHATLVRSISKSFVNSLRRWTSSQSSFEHLKDNESTELLDHSTATAVNECNVASNQGGGGGVVGVGVGTYAYDEKTLKESYAISKHLYSSDSILNNHTDNIYDEPNNIVSNSLGNSVDIIESDSSSPLPPPPPPVSIVKIKQTLCPYYQDHTRYFKAIPSEQDSITSTAQKFNPSGLSEIHDYDLYYGAKRNTYQQYDNSLQRKILYSPLNPSHHCHSHHYHSGMNTCGNRPNSRNSLNSRLSSSHNSLSVSSANKPDDSIFITQAMSHDALLTREISDFYNVPIDSDIYAFPVDMIPAERDGGGERLDSSLKEAKQRQLANDAFADTSTKYNQPKINRRNNRNKRKKRSSGNCEDEEGSEKAKHQTSALRLKYREPVNSTTAKGAESYSDEHASQEQLVTLSQEPLHMTLDEVKQFYHTLYSDTKSKGTLQSTQTSKSSATKCSHETICSVSSGRSRSNLGTARGKYTTNGKMNAKKMQSMNLVNDNINNNNNNNNNVNTVSNHNNQNQSSQVAQQGTHGSGSGSGSVGGGTESVSANKQTIHNEKKSQFTLNLKQKFCSIFRFRRSHGRCRTNSSETEENAGNRDRVCGTTQTTDDKRNKLQSRALPPLPKKAEPITEEYEEQTNTKPESRSFQFTSSIEKVKDYGWYWGPLSSEAAEKVLSNEPDGSFIVRDSSDDHYIFSLSFKLNNCVRHVRIEQDQGTFSFGSYAKFKSQTITEFIEKAVEHSRSGRYLFFLHRRPEHGPMRVQLTNPVSRFKHVQSLQHMCRFVILKAVIRKDLIQTLPLPRRLLDYLNYKHCYSEQVESDSSHSQISNEGST